MTSSPSSTSLLDDEEDDIEEPIIQLKQRSKEPQRSKEVLPQRPVYSGRSQSDNLRRWNSGKKKISIFILFYTH